MKRSQGFTVVEIIVVIVFLGIATTLLMIQKANLTAAQRDDQRKTAINAMYYNLEEVFFAKNGHYPAKIDSKTLRAMDPAYFTDPDGNAMNDQAANYRYNGTDCNNDACKGYKLTAEMEKEATYTKTNR